MKRVIVASFFVLALSMNAGARQCSNSTKPTVTFLVGSGAVSVTHVTGCYYNIAVDVTSGLGTYTSFVVRPFLDGQSIVSLSVRNASNTQPTFVRIVQSTDTSKTFNELRIVGWNPANTGPIILTELRLSGNLGLAGAIEVNSIDPASDSDVDIGGDLLNTIKIIKAPTSITQLVKMHVRGNLLGDIDGPTGSSWNFTIAVPSAAHPGPTSPTTSNSTSRRRAAAAIPASDSSACG